MHSGRLDLASQQTQQTVPGSVQTSSLCSVGAAKLAVREFGRVGLQRPAQAQSVYCSADNRVWYSVARNTSLTHGCLLSLWLRWLAHTHVSVVLFSPNFVVMFSFNL